MPHTLATLAVALRGMPRGAPILAATPDGLRRVSLGERAPYVRDEGGRLEGAPGASTGQYAIVLHPEQRDGAGSPSSIAALWETGWVARACCGPDPRLQLAGMR
jgi:hypothetical protein